MSNIYREIAKKVHPDISLITDSHLKMAEANKYKDNPRILLMLAKKWGLDLDYSKYNDIDTNESIYDDIIGATVNYTYKKGKRYYTTQGVVVHKRVVKSGKNAGKVELAIHNNYTLKVNKKLESEATIVGKLSSDKTKKFVDWYENKLSRKKDRQKARNKNRANDADYWFSYYGLEKNKVYRNSGVKVSVNSKGVYGTHTLLKTTNQYVFIPWESNKSGEKRVHIRNVIYVKEL